MTLAALIRGKRNTDGTRPANANFAKVANIPVNRGDIAPKLAELAPLAVAAPDTHGTVAPIEAEFPDTNKRLTENALPPLVVDNTPSTEKSTHTKDGNPTLAEIVEPGVTAGAIWVNPHKQGTPEARQASLIAVMEAVWTAKFQGIISKVLNGQAKLADFRQAVKAWERVCLEEIKGLKH